MRKIVWSCWLQGRIRAPWLVEQCLRSWEERNPGWDVRCLDQSSLARYIDVPDLSTKQITPTSYSDIVRILLLRTHGGVWTDATVYCNRPLDDWLEELVASGFFAFDNPGGPTLWDLLKSAPDRYISSPVRHGVALPLPPKIEEGIDTARPGLLERRKSWNRPAPSEFALPTEIWREVVARWRGRTDEITNARHRNMVGVILGETLEQKRFFDQMIGGREDLLGRRANGAGSPGTGDGVMGVRWLE